MATQTGSRGRKSFVVFGLILLIALFAGMATFVFFSKVNNTVKVFYVKNPAGLAKYQVISEGDLGTTDIQADTLKMIGGDQYQFVYVYDASAKDGKGGVSAIVGNYARFERVYGDVLFRGGISSIADGGGYVGSLYETPGYKLLTFQVPLVNALAGQLSPGDFIDVMSFDESSKTTTKILGAIEVVDIKYGSNPFARGTVTTAESSTDTTAAPTRNPLDNTVNSSLGDRAILIIRVPGNVVSGITQFLIKSDSLYVVATTPPTLIGGASVPATETVPAQGTSGSTGVTTTP